MKTKENSSRLRNLVLFAYGAYLVAWVALQFTTEPDSSVRELWADTYGVVALIGAVGGLGFAKKWGGLKSSLGKAITFLSIGLCAQVFGQIVYTYYFYAQNVEAPYPSIGDIGFFGSIPFYILGAWFLAKTIGFRFSLRQTSAKLLSFIVPAIVLALTYKTFLDDYVFADTDKLVVFLDFGYPLGQAVFVSIALLAYLVSRKLLGGTMRNKVLIILLGLAVQYAADFNFLHQTIQESWQNGGYGDMLYMTAYLLVSLGLISLGHFELGTTEAKEAE